MNDELIERVAKAIWSDFPIGSWLPQWEGSTFEELNVEIHASLRIMARAALEASGIDGAAAWWKQATVEGRETFLSRLGFYAVSDATWYVHPDKPSTCQGGK